MTTLAALIALTAIMVFIGGFVALLKPGLIRQTKGWKAMLYCFATSVLMFGTSVTLMPAPMLEKGEAHFYRTIDQEDSSVALRKRLGWVIVAPTAATLEDRAVTAIHAAKELHERSGADFVQIRLVADELTNWGGNGILAIAEYAPDGKGVSGQGEKGNKWKVSAADTAISEQQIMVAGLWGKQRDNYRNSDGLIDEKRLTAAISSALDIPVDDVRIPFISRSPSPYKGERYAMAEK